MRVSSPSSNAETKQSRGPAQFKAGVEEMKVPMEEPSDVTTLPDGSLVVVGDLSDTIAIIKPDGAATKIKLKGIKDGESGMESVAYDPGGHQLFVVSEKAGELVRYKLDAKKGTADLEKKVKLPFAGDNKGIEGLAYLPGERSPTARPQLVLAKEGKPRSLYMLDGDGGGKPQELKLDPKLKAACADFAALAVDPVSGNLFLASEESALVAELKLVRKGKDIEARLVQTTPLRGRDGDALPRVEGLTFNRRGDMFALLENERRLYRFERR